MSRKRRQEQGEAADAAAARAMTRLLNSGGRRRGPPDRDMTTAQAAAVRRPECAAGPGDLAEAARLLGDLGEAAKAAVTRAGGAAGTGGVVPLQVTCVLLSGYECLPR